MLMIQGVNAETKKCNIWQTCKSNEGAKPGDKLGPCTDPTKVAPPVFWEGGYDPMPLDSAGLTAKNQACPFFADDEPLCCSSDNMQI